jgi:hypothetical protein
MLNVEGQFDKFTKGKIAGSWLLSAFMVGLALVVGYGIRGSYDEALVCIQI